MTAKNPQSIVRSSPNRTKNTPPLHKTSNGEKSGYMGVTYDMVSNYELSNLVDREQHRTHAVRASGPVDRSYVQRVE